MEFSIIAAIDEQRGIGKDGNIPWNIPEDMLFFKKITEGSAVIMGRITFESICRVGTNIGLKNRTNIIISDTNYDYNGIFVFKSLDIALEYCKENQHIFNSVFVIGGEMLYKTAIIHPLCRYLYITNIYDNYQCDRFFPKIPNEFSIFERLSIGYNLSVVKYEYKNQCEIQYLHIMHNLLTQISHNNRTKIKTKSLFAQSIRFNLTDNDSLILPLLTSKRINFNIVLDELLFFINGNTNTNKLMSKIWKPNTTREFIDSVGLDYSPGDMGPMYGFQWRHWGAVYSGADCCYDNTGIDQLKTIIDSLKTDPFNRRHVVSAWNVSDIKKGVLAPCHILFQFIVTYVNNTMILNCVLTQRSGDFFLGVPFNICSYGLLTHFIAKLVNMQPGELVINIGDCHIYDNHIEQAKIQLGRKPRRFPTIKFLRDFNSIDDIKKEDILLSGYYPCEFIKADMVA